MGKFSRKKRPCSICRKWFLPDVCQQGRQKTCGEPDCKKELHRRSCDKWNKRNKEYFANNYLGKKIAQIEEVKSEEVKRRQFKPLSMDTKAPTRPNSPLILPHEIIISAYGVRNMIIIHYLIRKIITQIRGKKTGIP